MTALVFVGIGIGLFAQHAADAEVSGAMLEAGCRTSIIPIVLKTIRLFARHGLEADATGTMPEAMHGVPLSVFLVGPSVLKLKRLFARHGLEADATGTMSEAWSIFPCLVALRTWVIPPMLHIVSISTPSFASSR